MITKIKNKHSFPIQFSTFLVCLKLSGLKYNAEKEQKAAWDAKQKELAKIEEAKKIQQEKCKSSMLVKLFIAMMQGYILIQQMLLCNLSQAGQL